jgi:hypothetical protein
MPTRVNARRAGSFAPAAVTYADRPARLPTGRKFSFLKKETKNFYQCLRRPSCPGPETARALAKVFGSFFKKNFSAFPEFFAAMRQFKGRRY